MLQAIFGLFNRQKSPQFQDMNDSVWNWFPNRLRWSPTSIQDLEQAEGKMLSFVRKPFTVRFVNIVHNGKNCNIRTLSVNEDVKLTTPLVLLHGLGSGVGLWVVNLDSFADRRSVHAIDILGFGMSSRPTFTGNAEDVENQLVDSIENWRKEMNLEKFILLGHSMGGFLATSYALRYPTRIRHLVLADPWGFPERDKTVVRHIEIPFWVKAIGSVLRYFNPFTGLRIAGPWGPSVLKKIRPDLMEKFATIVEDPEIVSDYMYHCNAQKPSGEIAFKSMAEGIGWAKNPMMARMHDLDTNLPITFIYGARSWVDSQSGYTVQKMRKTADVHVTLVPNAGHHVYADQPDLFHHIVMAICDKVDEHLPYEYYHVSEFSGVDDFDDTESQFLNST